MVESESGDAVLRLGLVGEFGRPYRDGGCLVLCWTWTSPGLLTVCGWVYLSDADDKMAGGIKIVVDGGTSGIVLGVEGSKDNDAGVFSRPLLWSVEGGNGGTVRIPP